ncbi:hypothetical protein GIB67_003403 [Kingdonia uniflora]|uniref:Uncharacterized protein n=1 Tax=Kingdonia uniflora TaxID=39325 RepID=A0A7J7P8Y8_9MAGN|nr:hypothetical protein GIB67_003403 [Kingdonia uniflora]
MQNQDEDSHPSTLPGFRVIRDPERAVTQSRPERKKKRVEFEDVQQPIPNPSQENYPQRCITQLLEGVTHIYYTGKELAISFSVINRDSMRVHGTFITVIKVWKYISTIPQGCRGKYILAVYGYTFGQFI